MKSPLRLQSKYCALLYLLALVFMVAAQSAGAQVSGAIFTTTSTGTTVNGNIYGAKSDVYLNGGPQNEHANGLSPDGIYYFQVTDPSGAVLLSTDDVTCRQVVVSGGKIVGVPAGSAPATCTEPAASTTPGAFHNIGTPDPNNGQTPVQLCAPSGCPAGSPDYKNTPNSGGEYKAWLTPVANYSISGNNCSSKKSNITFGFCDSDSKTDNFKVKAPAMAFVSVCKFNDQNANGQQDSGEPLIPHWPITATGVVGDHGSGVATQTEDSGCVSFSVSDFTNGSATVTLTEGTLGPDWSQTAPADGACTLSGSDVNSADSCAVTGGVITISVAPGDNVNAPNFGNFNPNCTTGCTGQQLLVSKTAHPVVAYTWKIQKSVDNAVIDTSSSAIANYTVTVTHDNGTATMMGRIRISNPFGPDLSGITVTDVLSDAGNDGGTCTVTTPADVTAGDDTITVVAGSHVDASYSCTFSNVPAAGSNTNTATATWAAGTTAGTATFDFSRAIVVDGSVTVTDSLEGTLGTVSIDVSGNVTTTPTAPVTSSASGVFNYSKTFTDPAGTCTTHNNAATFTTNTSNTTGTASQSVQVCVGADLSVSKTATASFKRTFKWGITKNADKTEIDTSSGSSTTFNYTVGVTHDSGTDSGWRVTGVITVTNPNNWEAITANVADSIDNGGVCTVSGGSAVSVPASGSVTLSYTCTYASAPSLSAFTNTATATWDKGAAATPDASASGTATGAFSTPTLVDNSVTVTDPVAGGTLGTVKSTDPSPTTFSYSRTVTAPIGTCTTYNNTATFTTNTSGTTGSASQAVKVCGASDLTVRKTATGSFNSNITKTVSKPGLTEQSGGTATLNYTVTVTESGWTVSGNIIVSNPNDWEDVPVSVADALNIAATCSGGSGTVPRSSSLTLGYSCSFSGAPSATSGTNTATATWNAASAFTRDGSAAGSFGFSFNSLTISDTFNGVTTTLGTIAGNTPSTTYDYSHTLTVIGGSCQAFNNTAVIVQTGQQASTSATVCNTATGALTMGFWQNKNGQGIITGSASTGGVCNAGTFLRQYAPFQDLSPTAGCSAVATYVFNLIKAANASGTTMNAMLKAQMMATALDVFFSDPGLGGNKIGAAQPLAGVKIDLIHVCHMIDSTSGTGTCSGTFENSGPAFGGATALTVSQLLSFAASQSNVGGSLWYGQNKTIQGLAKDTFDEINNQVAAIAP